MKSTIELLVGCHITMKITLRFALTMAFLSFPLGAEAASWSAVISNEKMRVEFDLASLQRQGNVVTAWDREVYFSPEQALPGDFYVKSAKTLARYNCDARTADLLMRAYYSEDGSEIKTVSANFYGRPNYVIPDSEGEIKFDYACNYKKPQEIKKVVVAKKKTKPKEADKTAEPLAKEGAGAKATAKPALPEGPPKAPPKSVPIRQPSGVLPRAPA